MAEVKKTEKIDKKKPVIAVGDGPAIPSKEDVGLFTAWRVSIIGALAIIAYLAISKPDPYLAILKFVPDGILVTFQVTIEAILLALPVSYTHLTLPTKRIV